MKNLKNFFAGLGVILAFMLGGLIIIPLLLFYGICWLGMTHEERERERAEARRQ